jgi:NAD(P)-dependent dehydrogenase (short-subunit alcohol dehydrogenase family)
MALQHLTHVGRVAVVTGAAGVFGGEICVALARAGAEVVGVDRVPADATEERVTEAGGSWTFITADLTSPADVANVRDITDETFGRADIIVNNAGIAPVQDIDGHGYELWQKVLAVNLDAQFLMISSFLPLMKRNSWGRIVNIASSSIEAPTRGHAAYKASKMGVIGLTRAVAADTAEFGIRVNAVSPPFMETPLLPDRGGTYTDSIVQRQAIKRLGAPADAVGLVAFLTSDHADFITGQSIYADGGLGFT